MYTNLQIRLNETLYVDKKGFSKGITIHEKYIDFGAKILAKSIRNRAGD